MIPTLGRRNEYLRQTLESVVSQDAPVDVLVVCPSQAHAARSLAIDNGAAVSDDPGGLSAAINLGIATATSGHDYVNWLGDDDTLTPGSLRAVASALEAHPRAAVAFGQCQYVDESDRPLWMSRAGRIAPWVLPWGPNLIPQPGMLIRRTAWQDVGGLDESLAYTMDLDLLLRLKRWGPVIAVPRIVSTFRWHALSLTVSEREASLAESESVKRRYLPRALVPAAPAWEAPVRWATRRASRTVAGRAREASREPRTSQR